MNIFADFIDRVMKAVESLDLRAKDGGALDFSRITVEPPRDSSHGDLATNAAMVLSKAAGENPRALGERLAKVLAEDPDVAEATVAGPGFVNLRVGNALWPARLGQILGLVGQSGRRTTPAAQNASVESVS